MTTQHALLVVEVFFEGFFFKAAMRDVTSLWQRFFFEQASKIENVSDVCVVAVRAPKSAAFGSSSLTPLANTSGKVDMDMAVNWTVMLKLKQKSRQALQLGAHAEGGKTTLVTLTAALTNSLYTIRSSEANFQYVRCQGSSRGQSCGGHFRDGLTLRSGAVVSLKRSSRETGQGDRESMLRYGPSERRRTGCRWELSPNGIRSFHGQSRVLWSYEEQRRQTLRSIFVWAITTLYTSVLKDVTVTSQWGQRILCTGRSHRRTSKKLTQNQELHASTKLGSTTRASSVLNWLLVVAILLGMLGSIPNVRGEEGHVIERFVHSPGLHFEPIGKLYLSNRLWTVAVTINLTPLAERVDQALTKIVEAQVLCTKAKGNGVHLRLLMDQWHEDFQETKDFLDGLLGFDDSTKGKRGLINGIGAVAKSLFGTMDAEDAQQINDRLSHLEQGQEGYFRTSGRQIEIVNATIFQLEKAERTITRNEDTLRKTLREVNRRLDEGANRTALRVDMDEHFMLVEAVVQGVVRDVDRIKKLISGGKLMGTGVLSESHLLTVLKKAQLPKGLSFPVGLRASGMHALEEVSTSSVQQFGNKLVAVLKSPLVTYETYDVFATYGIPQRTSVELHSYLQPDSELLIMHGATQYVTMTYQQLGECRRLQGQYLCTEILPVQVVRTYSPCEVQMYTHPAVLPVTCEPKHIALQHLTLMRMHSGNTWLYIAPQPEEILIRCRASEKREMLQDAGILRVNDFCEVQTADFTIRGRETSGVELDLHVHPRLNLTLSEEDRRALQILPSSNITDVPLKSVIRNMDELKGLQVQLGLEKKHLDQEDTSFNYREFISRPSTLYLGALTMFVISLVIAGVCWYFNPCGRRGRMGRNATKGSSSIEDNYEVEIDQ